MVAAADGVPSIGRARSETTAARDTRVAVLSGTERTEIRQPEEHRARAACAGGRARLASLLLQMRGRDSRSRLARRDAGVG